MTVKNIIPVRFDEETREKLERLDKHYNAIASNKSAVIRYAVDQLYKSIVGEDKKNECV